MMWCLLISQVPFLYGLCDWQLVSPERQLQLQMACEEQARLADLAYQEMQRNYKAMRKALYTFLINVADSDALLRGYADVPSQRELPIIDVYTIDVENNVIDTFSIPLLPIVPEEDCEHFNLFMGQLTAWRQELQTFCNE